MRALHAHLWMGRMTRQYLPPYPLSASSSTVSYLIYSNGVLVPSSSHRRMYFGILSCDDTSLSNSPQCNAQSFLRSHNTSVLQNNYHHDANKCKMWKRKNGNDKGDDVYIHFPWGVGSYMHVPSRLLIENVTRGQAIIVEFCKLKRGTYSQGIIHVIIYLLVWDIKLHCWGLQVQCLHRVAGLFVEVG